MLLTDSHTSKEEPTTHVKPCDHTYDVDVMVNIDGLHTNGFILTAQKVCSIALSIFYSFL